MAMLTNNARILRAIQLKELPNLYMAIGRTTPWDNEAVPPVVDPDVLTIDELIYIKKITNKQLVLPQSGGEIDFDGDNYTAIDVVDAYVERVTKLLMTSSYYYDDIAPTSTTFRQVGILLNPKDSGANLLTGSQYLGASVADQGELIYLDNIVAITRSSEQIEELAVMVDL